MYEFLYDLLFVGKPFLFADGNSVNFPFLWTSAYLYFCRILEEWNYLQGRLIPITVHLENGMIGLW